MATSPLVQIRSGYQAAWRDLHLTVESGAAGWRARVQQHGRPLYTAQRMNAAAAKHAAVEFACFAEAPRSESPETVARHLRWSEYW